MRSCRVTILLLLLACSAFLPGPLLAQIFAEDARPAANSTPQIVAASNLNLYVKVQLDRRVKLSTLKPGDVVEGKLSRSVYSRDKEVLPDGSRVRLTVDEIERRRRAPNDHWPWVIKAFSPRHERYPRFQSAQVALGDGVEVPLRVSLLSISQEVEVHAALKKENTDKQRGNSGAGADLPALPATTPTQATKGQNTRPANFTANFEAVVLEGERSAEGPSGASAASSGQATTIAAGTRAKVVLLNDIRASKSRQGDSFHARLVEPVFSGSNVALPEGTIFEGKIVKRRSPRMLSRAGSLLLSFTGVTSPAGAGVPVAASVAGLQLDRRSHTTVDAEGQLKGERPGKAWMAINIGVTGGMAKAADDGTQLVIEAIVSSATDVSTAGTARIAAAGASTIFLLTRHGRDVVLPKFTEMEIAFDRPVSLAPVQPVTAAK